MTKADLATTAATRIPSATAIVFRRGESGNPPQLLMVIRSAAMRFAAGAAVFPGGKVDPADHDLAARLASPGADLADMAARIAAVRETLEEAGLVLAVKQTVTAAQAAAARTRLIELGNLAPVLDEFGWTLQLDRLEPFARWVRPDERAFDTRFYLVDLGTGAVPLDVDGTEHSHLLWTTAAAALEQARQGQLHLIFPTLCNLHRLARHADFAAALADARSHPPQEIIPAVTEIDGQPCLTIPEGIGYPVTSLPIAEARRG